MHSEQHTYTPLISKLFPLLLSFACSDMYYSSHKKCNTILALSELGAFDHFWAATHFASLLFWNFFMCTLLCIFLPHVTHSRNYCKRAHPVLWYSLRQFFFFALLKATMLGMPSLIRQLCWVAWAGDKELKNGKRRKGFHEEHRQNKRETATLGSTI